jgi:hypothetical protein
MRKKAKEVKVVSLLARFEMNTRLVESTTVDHYTTKFGK